MMRAAVPLAVAAVVVAAAAMATRNRAAGERPIPENPRRIVSLLPSCTELLFAVGAGDRVVAVSDYCAFPPEAAGKPRIGGLTLDFERIAALDPDLIVTADDLHHRANRQLRDAGYAVLALDPKSFADVAQALRRLGVATGCAEGGERAAANLERRVAETVRRMESARGRPTVYLEATAQPHAAGPGMTGDELIRLAGGRNIVTETHAGRWVPISWEAVLARDPEVVVVAHDYEPGPEARPGFAGLRAAKAGRVHRIDKAFVMFPTPRLAEGLELLARILHSECFDAPPK